MKTKTFGTLAGIFTAATLGIIIAGCATPPPPATAAVKGANGPQLWADNCIRCHNLRSPASYSDAQWEVVALHMRVRANLTANEHEEILAFLKAAH